VPLKAIGELKTCISTLAYGGLS